jgi:hypothetical protein
MVPAHGLRTAKRFPKKHQKSPVGKSALPTAARAATGTKTIHPGCPPPKTDSNTSGLLTSAKNNELREKIFEDLVLSLRMRMFQSVERWR